MTTRRHTAHKVILAALVMALLSVPLYLQHSDYHLNGDYPYLAGAAAVAGEAAPAAPQQPPSQSSMVHVTAGQTMLGDGLSGSAGQK